jgi:hypothetical protein
MSILVSDWAVHFPDGNSACVQIHEEGSTFRGKLKNEARRIVRLFYNMYPDIDICHGQAQYQNLTKLQAEKWLKGGAYLHGGKDANVRVSIVLYLSLMLCRAEPITLATKDFANYASPSSTRVRIPLPAFTRRFSARSSSKKDSHLLLLRLVCMELNLSLLTQFLDLLLHPRVSVRH